MERIPREYIEKIKAEVEAAVARGWDAADSEWRKMALLILCATALGTREFSVNDFRERLKAQPEKTHDNRAVGGLMKTAERWGWIENTGLTFPSKVGHKTPLTVWRSKIFQDLSFREIEVRETNQERLF